ncbi:MAG: hypothetical protein ACPGF7_10800 [Pontibacterium sp.]
MFAQAIAQPSVTVHQSTQAAPARVTLKQVKPMMPEAAKSEKAVAPVCYDFVGIAG